MAASISRIVFDDIVGAVFLDIAGAAPGNRVVRVVPTGGLEALHSYDLPDPGSVSDWAVPIGELVEYLVLPTASSFPEDAIASISYRVPGGLAFLRSMVQPELSMPVRVLSTGVESESARQTLFPIVGRRAPLVVFQSRAARAGTIQLLVIGRDERAGMEKLLSRGEPLLLNLCQTYVFPACRMAVSEARFERVEKRPDWFTLELDYDEVDDDDWLGVVDDYQPSPAGDVRYDAYDQLTHQQLRDQHGRYLGVLDGTKL